MVTVVNTTKYLSTNGTQQLVKPEETRQTVFNLILLHLLCFHSIVGMGQEGSATPLSVIDSQEGQHEFQQLMQHNTTANFPHEPYILENSAYVRSGTNSSYGTPEPGNLLLEHFGRGQNGPSLPHYGGLEQTVGNTYRCVDGVVD